MRPLTAPNKIMKCLALEPGLTKYILARRADLSYSRIHESTKRLEKEGIIKGEIIGKSKAGLNIKKYSLTAYGLKRIIGWYQYFPPISELDLKVVFERNRDRAPSIADKWDILKQTKNLNIMWGCMHVSDDVLVINFQEFFFEFRGSKEFEKIAKTLSADPDIRAELKKYVNNTLKTFESEGKALKTVRTFLKNIPSSRSPRKEKKKEVKSE